MQAFQGQCQDGSPGRGNQADLRCGGALIMLDRERSKRADGLLERRRANLPDLRLAGKRLQVQQQLRT